MSDHMHVALDAEPQLVGVVRHAARRWLTAVQWPEQETGELVFAISEALSNSVEHAYCEPRPGRVTLDLAVEHAGDRRTVRAVITDFGRWRKVRPRRDRGNGLALIKTLVGGLRVDSDDAGTRVAMRSASVPDDRDTVLDP